MTTLKKHIDLGGNIALFLIPSTLIHEPLLPQVGESPTEIGGAKERPQLVQVVAVVTNIWEE